MDHVIARHRHPRQDTRQVTRQVTGQTEATRPTAATPRAIVAAHFVACARGVAAAVAQARTQRFYRASGHPWAAALA